MLNLITAENSGNITITTSNDHTAHLQFESPKAIEELDDKFLRKAFDELHESNKSIIRQLLNKDQLKAIGLQ